jgi:hypothetical protein
MKQLNLTEIVTFDTDLTKSKVLAALSSNPLTIPLPLELNILLHHLMVNTFQRTFTSL